MGFFSKCTGYSTGNYYGGENTVAIHEATTGGKARTSLSAFAPGIEINPADGENLIISRIGNSDSFMVTIGGTNQKIAPDTERGERRIFSVSEDGETIGAIAKFKNDGSIILQSTDAGEAKTTTTFGADGKILINIPPSTEIEFSASGMKITVGGVVYDALTHIHPTGVGPSGPFTPA